MFTPKLYIKILNLSILNIKIMTFQDYLNLNEGKEEKPEIEDFIFKRSSGAKKYNNKQNKKVDLHY
jgi:hypothetical protein